MGGWVNISLGRGLITFCLRAGLDPTLTLLVAHVWYIYTNHAALTAAERGAPSCVTKERVAERWLWASKTDTHTLIKKFHKIVSP